MKATQFLAITVAVFALLSCSKEEGGSTQEVGHSNLSIKIVGETEAPKGRAAGTPTQAEESTINNFILYVFKADGSKDVDPIAYDKLPATGKADVVITTDAKEVFVVANTLTPKISDGTFVTNPTHEALLAVTSKSELQAVMGRGFTDIDPSPTIGIPTQTSANLWMSGKNDEAFTPVKEGNVTTTVTLKYVAAKVRITSVSVDPSVTGLKLSQVVVLNGGGATNFVPADGNTSLIPTFTPDSDAPFYVSGVAMSSFSVKPTVIGRNDSYYYVLTGDKTITPTTNQHYFYVFENDGEAFKDGAAPQKGHPTIVTLKCLDVDVNPCYYSVFFKADPDGTLGYDDQVIERGKCYDIAMTIKKLGNSDPTVPVLKTTVTVTITPAKWETVTINKVYE